MNQHSRIANVVKSTLAAIHNLSTDEIEILKAKKREEGEVWTQPSGRKVTKRGGRIIPTSDLKQGNKDKPASNHHEKKPIEQQLHKNSSQLEKDAQNESFKGLHDLAQSAKTSEDYMNGLKEIAQKFTPKQIETIKKYKKYVSKSTANLDNLYNEMLKAKADIESNSKKQKKTRLGTKALEEKSIQAILKYEYARINVQVYRTKALSALIGSKNLKDVGGYMAWDKKKSDSSWVKGNTHTQELADRVHSFADDLAGMIKD